MIQDINLRQKRLITKINQTNVTLIKLICFVKFIKKVNEAKIKREICILTRLKNGKNIIKLIETAIDFDEEYPCLVTNLKRYLNLLIMLTLDILFHFVQIMI